MAKITQASISVELEVLDYKEASNTALSINLTIEEAQSLYKLLKERFETYTPLQYPPGVRGYNITPTDDLMSQPLRTTGIHEDKNKSTS